MLGRNTLGTIDFAMRGAGRQQQCRAIEHAAQQKLALRQMLRHRVAGFANPQIDALLEAVGAVAAHHELPRANPPCIVQGNHIGYAALPAGFGKAGAELLDRM